MEQEYSEPRATTSLAGRTVLPGEPFESPTASQVPGPRETQSPQTASQAPEPAAQWDFGPAADQVSYEPTYVSEPSYPAEHGYPAPAYGTPDVLPAQEYDSLQQFASLPVAETPTAPTQYAPPDAAPAYPAADYPAPAYEAPSHEAPAYPAPAYDAAAAASPMAPPAYPAPPQQWPSQPAVPSPVIPSPANLQPNVFPGPAVPDDEPEGAHRKGKRKAKRDASREAKAAAATRVESPAPVSAPDLDEKKGPNKALVGLALVVVLGGAGYFAYTQLHKSNDSSTPAASVPVTPANPANPAAPTTGTVKYAYPTALAGFQLRTGSGGAALVRQMTSFAKSGYPAAMGTPSIASYGTNASASVVAESFHPAASKLAGAYSILLAGVRKPATGNVVGAFTQVPAGAAGGKMACGDQRGASPISYCVWQGKSTVGMVYMKGGPNTPVTQALTRELRAYAEH